MPISFVIPTRNRTRELAHTLAQLEQLDPEGLGGSPEIVVVDNGSDQVPEIPLRLSNGIPIRRVLLDTNLGAGARNIGVQQARGDWVIMLDDDSNICNGKIGAYLSSVDSRVGAIGGEIILPDGSHEAGGLPEVVVGCGCAIRRDAYLRVGGYDAGFGYYAEEYDLCAKLIAAGYTVGHTRALRFEHRKSIVGRDMDEILYRLVRNNGWVIQRYAPTENREDALAVMHARYRQIAINEDALTGYHRGRDELARTIDDQHWTPLSIDQWDRFVGNAALRATLTERLDLLAVTRVSLVGLPRGKGLGQIRETIESCGHSIVSGDDESPKTADIQVISTLSPGPMLDSMVRFPDALCPWSIEDLSLTGIDT